MGNTQVQQMWFDVTATHPWKTVTIAMTRDTHQGVGSHAVLHNFDIIWHCMSWNVKRHNEVSGKLIRLLTTLNSPRHCREGCKAHFGGHQASQRLKLSFQVCQRDGRLVTFLLNKCLQCSCDELILVFWKQTLHRNLWSVSVRYKVHTARYRRHYTHFLCHSMKKATVWNVCIKSFYNFSKWFLPWRLLEEPHMDRLNLMETEVHG